MMQPWEKNGKLIEVPDGGPVECDECPCSYEYEQCSWNEDEYSFEYEPCSWNITP